MFTYNRKSHIGGGGRKYFSHLGSFGIVININLRLNLVSARQIEKWN